MNIDLTGRTAIVTGGARGIGRAIALGLAELGADIGVIARNEDAGNAAVDQIRSLGRNAAFERCDVADPAAAKTAVDALRDALGGVSIVVNNAGITRDGLLLRMKDDDWTSVVDVNLRGAFNVTRAACKYIMKSQNGRIINITSVVGLIGNPGQANYAASKGGLIGFTKAVAKELAPRGVTVNAVAPGYIETDMTAAMDDKARENLTKAIPAGRYGQPEDVANAVAFLASDLASYITGHVLTVSGGMAM